MTGASPTIANTPSLRAVLVTPHRPTQPGAVSASLSFGWRAVLKIRRIPVQLFDIIVHPVVFTLMFSYLFGGALGGSTGRYLTYLVPGILVMTLLVTTGSTGSAVSTDIAKGVFDRFRTLPVWPAAPLVGALLADLARYALASTVVIALGEALGFRPRGGVAGVLAAVLLVLAFCFSLAWAWTALALVMKAPGAVLGLTQAVLYPLAFFSNIFIVPSTLPGWLQAFVHVNPGSRDPGADGRHRNRRTHRLRPRGKRHPHRRVRTGIAALVPRQMTRTAPPHGGTMAVPRRCAAPPDETQNPCLYRLAAARDDIPHEPRRPGPQCPAGSSQLRSLGPGTQHNRDRRTIRRELPCRASGLLPRGSPVRIPPGNRAG
jgi:ABC-2 type transport system permease protein